MNLGKNIQALRKALRISQAALAKMIGVDQSTVSDIETGATVDPGVTIICKIAQI